LVIFVLENKTDNVKTGRPNGKLGEKRIAATILE
jgi:hypothetical protein